MTEPLIFIDTIFNHKPTITIKAIFKILLTQKNQKYSFPVVQLDIIINTPLNIICNNLFSYSAVITVNK